jgi:hypothetical protein
MAPDVLALRAAGASAHAKWYRRFASSRNSSSFWICVQALQEQARMLAGAVAALSARHEALVTMQTLQADLRRKRARAEGMAGRQHKHAVRLSVCLA